MTDEEAMERFLSGGACQVSTGRCSLALAPSCVPGFDDWFLSDAGDACQVSTGRCTTPLPAGCIYDRGSLLAGFHNPWVYGSSANHAGRLDVPAWYHEINLTTGESLGLCGDQLRTLRFDRFTRILGDYLAGGTCIRKESRRKCKLRAV